MANFSFLIMETNQEIGDRSPQDYFEEIAEREPGALESQWIPMDRDLWRVENYRDFLAARQELLAGAANRFLKSLLHGEVPEKEAGEDVTQRIASELPGGIADDEEEYIRECGQWAEENGFPEPEREYELVDEVTGEQLAVLDLAWPDGLQTGLSEPVAVLLDEPHKVEDAARSAGYRFFRSVEEFKSYVTRKILSDTGIE